MKERKDQFEQFITDNFEKLAKQEEDKLKNDSDIQMPEGVRESVRAKLDDEIKKIEEQEAYAHLSEEDRRALELGRKLMQEKTEPQEASSEEQDASAGTVKKTSFAPRRLRVCLILAAALILVMAVGITSLGGPERVIQMLTQNVGEREVEQVISSDDSMVIVEDEEEAYQKLYQYFGAGIVKIWNRPTDMKFREMIYNEGMQIAELFYQVREKKVVFYINASYTESSLGVDADDVIVGNDTRRNSQCEIKITQYFVEETDEEKYSAKFEYNGLEYFLVGQITKEEFDVIIDGLYFSP